MGGANPQQDVGCPECGSQHLIYDSKRGERVCRDCGLVIEEGRVDKGPEWRAFTSEEIARKTRGTTHLKTPTTLYPRGRDAFGRKISLSQRMEMQRLKKWQSRSAVHTSEERNFALAKTELRRLCDVLHISSSAKDTAWDIYKKAFRQGLVQGRTINGMVAAAIAIACRQLQIAKSIHDVADKSQVEFKEISDNFRLIVKELNLRNPIHDLSIHVEKAGNLLGLSQKTKQLAFDILKEARRRKEVAGRDPRGLAGATLYISCLETGEKRTQEEIAEATGVTSVTIRNRYKELKRKLGTDLDNFIYMEVNTEDIIVET